MSESHRQYYPTLTDKERKVLYCKLRQRHKTRFVLCRLLKKGTRLLGRIMVRNRILRYRRSIDPRGEPLYSRPAPWKCMIKTNDIAYLLGISERYAQEKHKMLKDELGKKYITVKEFCKSVDLDEEYAQRLLNDGQAREINSAKFQKMIDEINRRYDEDIRKVKEAAQKEKEEEAKKKQEEDVIKKIETQAKEKKPSSEKVKTLPIKDDKNKKIAKPKNAS